MMASSIASLLNMPVNPPVKLARTLLKVQVVDLLRSQIILGRIPPGTPLVERDLAETLQISRVPVRDALQELEKEGLVLCTATNRRSVIQLTKRDIQELYEVRLQLEQLAVEQAARNRSPAHREQLSATLAAMQRAFDEHDQPAFPRTDVDLHRAIWAQADNRHLEKMLQTMAGQLFMFASINTQLYDWAEVVELHRDLVSHINDGSVDGARASIERHMQNSLDRALRAFRSSSAESGLGTSD
jgi:DNA-binding GntR family transcriptional regulator